MTVSAGAVASAMTDPSGEDTITGLSAGQYSITPSRRGWKFTPPSRTVSVPPDATGQDFQALPEPSWTLMYYVAADNDLTEALPHKLRYLQDAGANPHANIVALVDYSGGQARYMVFGPDAPPSIGQGELSTGRPETLRDFVEWTQDSYPAEHYALIFDDHGHGHTGCAYDEEAPEDVEDCAGTSCLALNEWGEALSEADDIDIIQMTACLMGSIESAYQLRGLADYYVASEGILWGPVPDWHVTGYTGEADGEPLVIAELGASTTPRELAIAIAQSYRLTCAGYDRPGTVSVADLGLVESVADKTSALADLLRADMNQVHDMVTDIKNQVQRFDSIDPDQAIDTDDEVVDLYHFAELFRTKTTDSAIETAATELQSVITDYIVGEDEYELGWSGGWDEDGSHFCWDHSNSHGVSIFFADYSRSFYRESWLDFAAGTEWDIDSSSAVSQSHTERTQATIGLGPDAG